MPSLYPLTTIALVVALFVYFGLSAAVGMARARWNVPAPASSGHPEFDKRYRVQMNTLEQLAMFVPAVIVGAPVLGDAITAALAALWSVGRIVYFRLYIADPAKRGPGFALTLTPSMVLLLAGVWGAISSL